MKKRGKISLFLVTLMVTAMLPATVFAATDGKVDLNKADVIMETSNPEIGIAFFIEDESMAKGYNTKTKTGTGYFYKTSDKSKIADFNCTGTFSYDGEICNVTEVSTSVWNTINGYRVDVSESKNQISPTYARATGVFDLYKLGVFGDTQTSSATINVYCNQKGSTDVEFNSDDD